MTTRTALLDWLLALLPLFGTFARRGGPRMNRGRIPEVNGTPSTPPPTGDVFDDTFDSTFG